MYRIILFLLLFSSVLYSQPGGLFPHSIHCWHLSQDAIDCIQDSAQAYVYPVPSDSVSPDTSYVSADSGLGGGGWLELGDSVGVHVNVDSITIDILDDTLRADTTMLATRTYVTDTLGAYWDTTNVKTIVSDSSQYYYYKSVSTIDFPDYEDTTPWDNDAGDDSVYICTWNETATMYNYMEVKADTNSTDKLYLWFKWDFEAPRSVSDITDSLIILQYKTSSSDTDSVAVKLYIYEGTTLRHTLANAAASTSWANLAFLKTDGTLSEIVTGDRCSVIARITAQYGATVNPTVWISRFERRYW